MLFLDSMAWFRKEDPTPFDATPIPGLFFLHGDLWAQQWRNLWVEGRKYPMVRFPSGQDFPIWEGSPSPIIHIYGEMDLPLYDTCQTALKQANLIAEACGYMARKIGDTQLEVWGHEDAEHFLISYDNEARMILDIQQIKEPKVPPRKSLLDDEIRAKLPPLASTETLGLEAIALVKFFAPDSHWIWYVVEFDGDDMLFGLMAGFEIELGYFSLTDLEDVPDPSRPPIERDLYYEPKTLAELKRLHEQS